MCIGLLLDEILEGEFYLHPCFLTLYTAGFKL